MQTYRLEWNLCQINGILNFPYEAHMQSLIFTWKWFSVILRNVQLTEMWNSIKLMGSVAAVQTYF